MFPDSRGFYHTAQLYRKKPFATMRKLRKNAIKINNPVLVSFIFVYILAILLPFSSVRLL